MEGFCIGSVNMEFALWNGKKISASEVSAEYAYEMQVRDVSSKELLCPDPNCANPILRYCHGDKKDAYFAHICNEHCDYGDYDRDTPSQIKLVCKRLYNHLASLGYNVQMEIKVLEHHYTHILITTDNNERIAIELGNQRTSEKRIERITQEYKDAGILAQWIVVDNLDIPDGEDRVYCLKRYILNETPNRDLIIIEPETYRVGQYKIDEKRYFSLGREIFSANYPKTYTIESTLEDIVFENNELTLPGFINSYNTWYEKKNRQFLKRKEQLEKEATEERKRQAERLEEIRQKQKEERAKRGQTFTYTPYKPVTPAPVFQPPEPEVKPQLTYEERKAEIIDKINQTKNVVLDSTGVKWIKCEICGKVDEAFKFVMYGGKNKATLGTCAECSRKGNK